MTDLPLIPRPAELERTGGSWKMPESVNISSGVIGSGLYRAGELLAEKIVKSNLGPREVKFATASDSRPDITLRISDDNIDNIEGYYLEITEKIVRLEASSYIGLVWAIQTLLQILAAGPEIPCLVCHDRPRFSWRGMHLDVARHYFPVEFILKYLELLSLHKLNVFHWHLTDDQGWRLEIEKYPRLTEIGAWRTEANGCQYGGFYTRRDIKTVVNYAAKLGIRVIPEIDLPGHASALLAAYPEHSCTGEPVAIPNSWGIFDNTLCPSRDTTYRFIEHILDEVTEMFDSPFIHIGGDECPTGQWERHASCRELMARHNFDGFGDLQGIFHRRIAEILRTIGRRTIGWDEILTHDPPADAIIMCWRDSKFAIEALQKGHDVILSPTDHCYFDYYQAEEGEPKAIGGHLSLDKVYAFDPSPLSEIETGKILGGQANVWTEYMETTSKVEYMIIPRICALSEALWSPVKTKDRRKFQQKLPAHLKSLAETGYNYRALD
ncbi:MAG: beta-N-acetylhexosaminidase [FCB group bacterium]|nr:beta-N-acetylhexosaminidase [FCB group bacterium]